MSIALSYSPSTTPSDELYELVQACISQDRRAQARLYNLFYPTMRGLVMRYFPQAEAADEILCEGFLKAFQKLNTFSFLGSFEGWLKRIMFNTVIDYARAHLKYKKKILFIEQEVVIDKDHGSRLYMNQLLELIQTLPDDQRMVFNMYVMDDMSHKDISKTLNIPIGTSKWYLSQARKNLKYKIEQLENNQ